MRFGNAKNNRRMHPRQSSVDTLCRAFHAIIHSRTTRIDCRRVHGRVRRSWCCFCVHPGVGHVPPRSNSSSEHSLIPSGIMARTCPALARTIRRTYRGTRAQLNHLGSSSKAHTERLGLHFGVPRSVPILARDHHRVSLPMRPPTHSTRELARSSSDRPHTCTSHRRRHRHSTSARFGDYCPVASGMAGIAW